MRYEIIKDEKDSVKRIRVQNKDLLKNFIISNIIYVKVENSNEINRYFLLIEENNRIKIDWGSSKKEDVLTESAFYCLKHPSPMIVANPYQHAEEHLLNESIKQEKESKEMKINYLAEFIEDKFPEHIFIQRENGFFLIGNFNDDLEICCTINNDLKDYDLILLINGDMRIDPKLEFSLDNFDRKKFYEKVKIVENSFINRIVKPFNKENIKEGRKGFNKITILPYDDLIYRVNYDEKIRFDIIIEESIKEKSPNFKELKDQISTILKENVKKFNIWSNEEIFNKNKFVRINIDSGEDIFKIIDLIETNIKNIACKFYGDIIDNEQLLENYLKKSIKFGYLSYGIEVNINKSELDKRKMHENMQNEWEKYLRILAKKSLDNNSILNLKIIKEGNKISLKDLSIIKFYIDQLSSHENKDIQKIIQIANGESKIENKEEALRLYALNKKIIDLNIQFRSEEINKEFEEISLKFLNYFYHEYWDEYLPKEMNQIELSKKNIKRSAKENIIKSDEEMQTQLFKKIYNIIDEENRRAEKERSIERNIYLNVSDYNKKQINEILTNSEYDFGNLSSPDFSFKFIEDESNKKFLGILFNHNAFAPKINKIADLNSNLDVQYIEDKRYRLYNQIIELVENENKIATKENRLENDLTMDIYDYEPSVVKDVIDNFDFSSTRSNNFKIKREKDILFIEYEHNEIKESIPFDSILKSLSHFGQNKKGYELKSTPNENGSYSSNEFLYTLYPSSKFNINEIFKDFKLIERININDFLTKYRKITRELLKKAKLDELDYYEIKLVYGESIFTLSYIYYILNNLKRININEIEFLGNGKFESVLIIKDTTWFLTLGSTIGYDKNRYFYLDWKTNKDIREKVESFIEKHRKEWEREREKEFEERK